MAVHAAILQLLIVPEGIHVEVLYAALLYLYVVPDLIVGFDEAIGEIRVDLVAHHAPVEGLVLYPSATNACRDGDFKLFVGRLLHQLFPIVDVEYGFVAAGI